MATVTTVWTTLRDMGFTAERHCTSPTVTAADVESAFVDELGHGASLLSNFRPNWTSAPRRGTTQRQAARRNRSAGGCDPVASVGENVNQLAASSPTKFHHTVSCRKQSVVATQAHVVSRVELGAPLADQDAAGTHPAAVVDLDP